MSILAIPAGPVEDNLVELHRREHRLAAGTEKAWKRDPYC